MVYINIFDNHYTSLSECVFNNKYGCEPKCISSSSSSPVSELELLNLVQAYLVTQEGKEFANSLVTLCNGTIIHDTEGISAAADTIFEEICVNCNGVANDHVSQSE